MLSFNRAAHTRLSAATLALLLVTPGSEANAAVVSTFDTDADGWTLFQNAGAPFDWLPTGGNPDGHIAATDKTTGWAYVQAPAKFLAPAPYNGTFSFDLRVDNLQPVPGFPPVVYNVRVGLQGAGLTLINEGGLPTTSWKNYNFVLDETFSSGWRKFSDLSQNYNPLAPMATQAEMQNVLANLTRVVIATDYTNNAIDNNIPNAAVDRTFIDNVQISEAATVPEPSSLVMLLAGMAFLGSRRRRNANRGLSA